MIRPFEERDAHTVLALTRELLPHRVETVETVLFDAGRSAVWVAEVAREVVGVARVRDRKLALGVAPKARRRGIGAALWDRVADEVDSMWSADGAGVAFARDRGLVPVREVVVSSLDLGRVGDVPPESLPDVQLVRWDELRSVPDVLGQAEHVGFPALVPEGSWAALFAGRPVAYALLVADERGVGENQHTFTLPEHRGRGVATLCKRALVVSARELGLHTLVTGNDVTNAPILALNRRLGYVPQHVQVTLSRA